MDNVVKIKIIRESDNASFSIGTGENWRFLKNGIDGFAKIVNTLSYTDNAISDGGIFTSEHVSKVDRTIKFCYLDRDNNVNARALAINFFNIKDRFKIYFTYSNKTYWADAKIYKFDVETTSDINSRLDITVTFMFANPYWNSYDNFGKNIAGLIPSLAFPYLSNPAFGGFTAGIFRFARKVVLVNKGDIETQCQVVITAEDEVTNPKIVINSEYVRLIDTLVKNDVVVMDFSAFPPTVKKNDENFIGHCDRTSSFDGMNLQTGENIIEYTADNGSNHMNVTVYYYQKYGAI